MVAAFNLFETAATGGTYTLLIEESDFLLGKISWALGDASSLSLPLLGETGTELSVIPLVSSGESVRSFRVVGSDLILTTTQDAVLNAADVFVQSISFTHLDGPEGVETVLVLSARTPNGILLTRVATSTVYVK